MLLLATLLIAAGQPSPAEGTLLSCGTGLWVEHGRQCPPIGPHPVYLYFEWDDASLTEQSRALVEYVAEGARRRESAGAPTLSHMIEGHADQSGGRAYNLELSRRRAEAVRDQLVSLGMRPNLLRISYLGEEQPVVQGPDGSREPTNRRVVITLIHDLD